MFVNLLKPRWRHPNAAVRSIAATKLNPNKKTDADKLRELAYHDPDLTVRSIAITRLTDLQLLIELLEQSNNPALAELAATRLNTLTEQGIINPIQLEAVQDQTAISLLICFSQSEALHKKLLPCINNEDLLADIAMRAPLTATRQQAATQLNDPDCLEKVRHFAKDHDKVVYRITRETLKRSQQLELEQQAIQHERNRLLDALHNLINSTDRQHFNARFQALQNQWKELPDPQQTEAIETYQQLVEQAETLLQQQAEQQAQIAKAEAVQAMASQHFALCQRLLVELLEQLSNHSISQPDSEHCLSILEQHAQPLATELAQHLTDSKRRETEKTIAIIEACYLLKQHSLAFCSLIEQANEADELPALQQSHQAIKQALQVHQ